MRTAGVWLTILSISTFLTAVAEGAQVPATVLAHKIQRAELFDLLTYPARIVAKVNTTILAESDGIVSRIHAPLGQKVSSQQRLMTLRHTDPIYQYSPVAILAPVSGVVSSVEVTEGSQVTKGQKLASVTDPRKLQVLVEVPALDLALVSQGLAGELRIAGREAPVAVQVRGVSPFVDPITGTATAEIDFAQANSGLAPGILGQVTFKADTHQGFSIPEQAIFLRGKDSFVRILQGGKAKQVAIRVGRRQRGFVEVLSGLQENDVLVERTSRYVTDGEAVQIEGNAS